MSLCSRAGDLTKPWESDLALCPQLIERSGAHSSDEELLIKQRVIRSHSAGKVMVLAVVVAQSRVSFGRDELVDVKILANAHHQNDA